jgi:hypothetical protein
MYNIDSTNSQSLFLELLLVLSRKRASLSRAFSEQEWEGALALAKDQSIAGVLFPAIESLPKEQYPPKHPTIHWWNAAEQIEQNTIKVTVAGKEAIQFFREQGFACCLLKGAAVGRYYPQPNKRSSGDVDIWIDGGRRKIYDFARSYDAEGKLYGVNYHHIHFHLFKDVHLEVHIWPSYLSSPLRNYRLHRFCNLYKPTMESSMPCLAFDRVFILLHCYRHLTGNGVGLRQIMDYYYVLKQGFTPEEKADTVKWIKKLGMLRFASGIMWLLQEVFGLESDEAHQLLLPNEKEGRFLLHEILLTGNMGHTDPRPWGSRKTPLKRFFHNLRRDYYLAGHYPQEVLWQPVFSIWLYFWRLRKGLLGDKG